MTFKVKGRQVGKRSHGLVEIPMPEPRRIVVSKHAKAKRPKKAKPK